MTRAKTWPRATEKKGWNPGTKTPDAPGVYRRSYTGTDRLYSVWDGTTWGKTYGTPQMAAAMDFTPSSSQLMPWRPVP